MDVGNELLVESPALLVGTDVESAEVALSAVELDDCEAGADVADVEDVDASGELVALAAEVADAPADDPEFEGSSGLFPKMLSARRTVISRATRSSLLRRS